MNSENKPTPNEPSSGFKAVDQAALAAEAEVEANANAGEPVFDEAAIARSEVESARDATTQATGGATSDRLSGADAFRPPEGKSFAAEVLELTRESAQIQMAAVARIVACRSPQEVLKVQTELVAQAMRRMADAAARLRGAALRDFTTLAKQPPDSSPH